MGLYKEASLKGKIQFSTVDLLLLTSLVKLRFIQTILLTPFTKQGTLVRNFNSTEPSP
jgi:hypothetical protein